MPKRNYLFTVLILLSILPMLLRSQDNEEQAKININKGADLMNRYVWRGADYGASPSIQPYLSLTAKNFELGSWGSISSLGNYAEIDLYAKYSFKGISIIATDYFFPVENAKNSLNMNNKYLEYDNKKTFHTIEAALQYKGNEKCPVSIYAGTFIYGNDKNWGYDKDKDNDLKNYYSTYIELGYTFKINNENLDVFMGLTPEAGAYGNTFGVINAGFTGYKNIKLTDKFELPVKASLICNPQMQNIYLVFGITL
ncbi:MAG: hypothetical protein KA792_07000 [Bacteroidales bacterium]|nr:hypothetical protein [Bacteroidales bacterium]